MHRIHKQYDREVVKALLDPSRNASKLDKIENDPNTQTEESEDGFEKGTMANFDEDEKQIEQLTPRVHIVNKKKDLDRGDASTLTKKKDFQILENKCEKVVQNRKYIICNCMNDDCSEAKREDHGLVKKDQGPIKREKHGVIRKEDHETIKREGYGSMRREDKRSPVKESHGLFKKDVHVVDQRREVYCCSCRRVSLLQEQQNNYGISKRDSHSATKDSYRSNRNNTNSNRLFSCCSYMNKENRHINRKEIKEQKVRKGNAKGVNFSKHEDMRAKKEGYPFAFDVSEDLIKPLDSEVAFEIVRDETKRLIYKPKAKRVRQKPKAKIRVLLTNNADLYRRNFLRRKYMQNEMKPRNRMSIEQSRTERRLYPQQYNLHPNENYNNSPKKFKSKQKKMSVYSSSPVHQKRRLKKKEDAKGFAVRSRTKSTTPTTTSGMATLAPCSISDATQPYYEAWVDTKPASRLSGSLDYPHNTALESCSSAGSLDDFNNWFRVNLNDDKSLGTLKIRR